MKQGDKLFDLFVIKKGSFKLEMNRTQKSKLIFDINYFMNYQNVSKEPFVGERTYELDGNLNVCYKDILAVLGKKQMIGNCEMLLNYENSLFTVTAEEDDSELIRIPREEIAYFLSKI